ncbi:MAG: hypothetical protein IPM17_12540 [Verrucomicrobia bacterium]|jgi:hypothetical protein|nr:hypothetical protein [Verrucomicrobiota bacterium]
MLPKSVSALRGDRRAIASNGTVTWGGQIFRITTESLPPVYPGTLAANRDPGHYDPVWPPGEVNLRWWYHTADTWWPIDPPPLEVLTDNTYAHWTTEHNGSHATSEHVLLVWAGHRGRSPRSAYFPNRNQHDVRLARVPWP